MAEEKMNKDEQIGIHKGSLSALAAERNALVNMVTIVDQLMQAHIKVLKDLGVDLEAEAKKAQEAMQKQPSQQPNKKGLVERF